MCDVNQGRDCKLAAFFRFAFLGRFLCSLNRLDDHLFGEVRFMDFCDLHPFPGLEIFVMSKEVFDLLDCDFG